MIVYPPSPRPTRRRMVQWRQTNVEEGVVRVDEAMLSNLIKKEPIEKYYKLDPEPFATGMFASVRRCRSLESGEVLAAKFSSRLRYGEDATREIHHEIALLSLCSPSPRIIKLHDVFQTPAEFIIVMEYAPGGDMQTIIDDNLVPYERDVVKFVQDVVEGLAYLHHRKIAHLDIKPQNLVMMGDFPDCEVKVCDFEISRVILDGSQVHEILGTPEYVAPEILHYEPITLAADMWSLGVTVYVLLTGFSPFGGETDQETFLNISRAQVDFPDELFEDISEEAKDFVRRLLLRNPTERMTAKECLKHPWLAKNRQTTRPRSRRHATKSDRRVGCSSCAPSNQNLRSYLSKSREALFEKVMKRNGLRKTTLVQQYQRTRRMCESQMSLVSKSRERALMKESIMSRSREKLYGLKSLSKSQEVLSLYRSVLNLQEGADEKTKALPGIFKLKGDGSLNSSVVSISDVENTQNLEEEEEAVLDIIPRLSCATLMDNQEENKENIRTAPQEPKDNMYNLPEAYGSTIKPTLIDSNENNNVEKPNKNVVERLVLKEPSEVTEDDQPQSPVSTDSMSLTEGATTSEEDLRRIDGETSEEDEPRFTVAQLVSAYNKHQEVVTKTSLEVTMKIPDTEAKLASKFPTGPNALRLFIPNIRISRHKPKKRMPRKKTGITLPEIQIEEVDGINEKSCDVKDDKEPEGLRLGVEAPPPKYLRSESFSSETSKSSQEDDIKPIKSSKRPYYMTAREEPISNVAKTVELFNNGIGNNRPDRKSFSSPRPPTLESDKTRRKSTPPTMKPFISTDPSQM